MEVNEEPLAITFKTARKIGPYGPTTLWKLVKEGRLEIVRVPGVRRSAISYASFKQLLTPSPLPTLPNNDVTCALARNKSAPKKMASKGRKRLRRAKERVQE